MKKKIVLTPFIIFILLSINNYSKDLNIGAGYNGYFSSNILMNSTEISDYISSFSFDLNLSKKNFNFYIDGLSNIYKDNSEFNSFKIEPGFEYLKYLKGRNYLYLNISYPILSYKEYFIDFNYSGPVVQFGAKFYLKPTLLFKAGYNFQFRNYTNFSSFDFTNHTFFLELNKFYRSQTTIRVQSGINYRNYPHIKNYDEYNNETGVVNALLVPNIFGLLRVSQGLGAKVGIFGEMEFRKNFSGLTDAKTLIQNSYVIYPYNDNYLWDGSRISFSLKFIPFYEIAVSGNFSYYNKNYPGIFVMDEEGLVSTPETERKDSLFQFGINITKKINKLDLYLNTIIKNNSSNDLYFNYKSFALSVGIGYYF